MHRNFLLAYQGYLPLGVGSQVLKQAASGQLGDRSC